MAENVGRPLVGPPVVDEVMDGVLLVGADAGVARHPRRSEQDVPLVGFEEGHRRVVAEKRRAEEVHEREAVRVARRRRAGGVEVGPAGDEAVGAGHVARHRDHVAPGHVPVGHRARELAVEHLVEAEDVSGRVSCEGLVGAEVRRGRAHEAVDAVARVCGVSPEVDARDDATVGVRDDVDLAGAGGARGAPPRLGREAVDERAEVAGEDGRAPAPVVGEAPLVEGGRVGVERVAGVAGCCEPVVNVTVDDPRRSDALDDLGGDDRLDARPAVGLHRDPAHPVVAAVVGGREREPEVGAVGGAEPRSADAGREDHGPPGLRELGRPAVGAERRERDPVAGAERDRRRERARGVGRDERERLGAAGPVAPVAGSEGGHAVDGDGVAGGGEAADARRGEREHARWGRDRGRRAGPRAARRAVVGDIERSAEAEALGVGHGHLERVEVDARPGAGIRHERAEEDVPVRVAARARADSGLGGVGEPERPGAVGLAQAVGRDAEPVAGYADARGAVDAEAVAGEARDGEAADGDAAGGHAEAVDGPGEQMAVEPHEPARLRRAVEGHGPCDGWERGGWRDPGGTTAGDGERDVRRGPGRRDEVRLLQRGAERALVARRGRVGVAASVPGDGIGGVGGAGDDEGGGGRSEHGPPRLRLPLRVRPRPDDDAAVVGDGPGGGERPAGEVNAARDERGAEAHHARRCGPDDRHKPTRVVALPHDDGPVGRDV